jgi:hypothetical protein
MEIGALEKSIKSFFIPTRESPGQILMDLGSTAAELESVGEQKELKEEESETLGMLLVETDIRPMQYT